MKSSRFFSQIIAYHIILFVSFSISINYFVEIQYINLGFYILFHILIIYFAFYYFHFSLYFFILFYGIFYDIILLDNIGPHLITLLFFLFIVPKSKNYIINLGQNRIIYLIFILVITLIFIEMLLSSIILDYTFNFYEFLKIITINAILFFPTIYFISKIKNH